jgi:hypothetical protein
LELRNPGLRILPTVMAHVGKKADHDLELILKLARISYICLKLIDMESLRIEIVNPKAKSIIKYLADMDLIRIKKDKIKNEFAELLAKLRRNSDQVPSLEEITKEVEPVRKARYEK